MFTTFARALFVSGLAAGVLCLEAGSAAQITIAPPTAPPQVPPTYRGSVELVNVTATVLDRTGRFVPDLSQDDFTVFEDGVPQTITYFSAARVPVSLGLALDTSGSMTGERIEAARTALDRFLIDLLGPDDEVFMYRFSDQPYLLQDWTTDRAGLARILGRIVPAGGTALYDTVTQAIPLAQEGRHPKKALVLLSDGNDTASHNGPRETARLIRNSGILVYAIGIDSVPERLAPRPPTRRPPTVRPPRPFPWPGGGRRPPVWREQAQVRSNWSGGGLERVNVAALRELTDDSGGRSEIITEPSALRPATARIADELSRQYELGYTSNRVKKDGQWHTIRVETRHSAYEVRSRSGYVAN